VIREDVLRSIVDNALMEMESCGLLIGVFRELYVEVLEHRSAGNILGSRYEFEIDPRDVIEAYNNARSRGLEIVGIYHTHIGYPPIPSTKDIEGMRLWPIPWLIISLPEREKTAWMLCNERLVGLEIILDISRGGGQAVA
jgi:proteasome lid subunit RPN8/RPN11